MTLKEKLAKAKLVNKYTVERDFYMQAAEKANGNFAGFYAGAIMFPVAWAHGTWLWFQ